MIFFSKNQIPTNQLLSKIPQNRFQRNPRYTVIKILQQFFGLKSFQNSVHVFDIFLKME